MRVWRGAETVDHADNINEARGREAAPVQVRRVGDPRGADEHVLTLDVLGRELVVIGAVGGVGALLVQLALLAGHDVVGAVSRPGHVAAAKELELTTVVTDVLDLPAASVDAVVDSAGMSPGAVLRAGGSYLSISDDPLPDIPGARGMGVREDGAGLARLAALVDAGSLRLWIAERFPQRRIREAHERFEAGGLVGKIVIDF